MTAEVASPAGARSMGFGEAIATCLRKYAVFSGRATRPEYWFWALFQALLALILYPLIWLLLLPFRLVGIAVGGVLELVKAIIFLPARLLSGPRRAY